MPHCEEFLYDAVLAANAARGALVHMAVLGNSFAEYAERTSVRLSGAPSCASWVLRLQPLVTGATRQRLRSRRLA